MLYRNQDKGIVAGVASGIADYYELPAWYIRSLFIGLFFLFGLGFLLYLIAWFLIPDNQNQANALFQ